MSADLLAIADQAARRIPPLWPLSASVAVNPFLGQRHQTLAATHAQLRRLAGVDAIPPRTWHRQRIETGQITRADLRAALNASPHATRPASVDALLSAAERPRPAAEAIPDIAGLAQSAGGIDWPGIIEGRIGQWASGYFDRGQALWAAPQRGDAWTAFRHDAMHDLTPEILGLTGFASFIAASPDQPGDALARAFDRLGLDAETAAGYWHALLVRLGGWAQYARYQQWQAELAGGTDTTPVGLLAVRLIWDEALHAHYGSALETQWAEAKRAYAEPVRPGYEDIVDEILQEASERAVQRRTTACLNASPAPAAAAEDHDRAADHPGRPELQAAFCIDVRAEVYRRALEQVAPTAQTLGFAGFFGLPVSHRGFASDVDEARLPALLASGLQSRAGGRRISAGDTATRHTARARRAWGRFKLAAVSSFAFVEAMGPVYIARLVRDALGLGNAAPPDEPAPRLTPEPSIATRIEIAEGILRAMSLTRGFAPVVLLVGHRATVTNNPHASALQCGACGGYGGEVNARLLAGLLNDGAVRDGLRARGIDIPGDTCFVAGLHDTTRDHIRLYDHDVDRPIDPEPLSRIRTWLTDAGALARIERGHDLPRAKGAEDIERRARDWSEVRPEWGLAGCQQLIAAPRALTRQLDLGGRAFLHEYDWRADAANGYPVLDLLLTAPVVVASWISLQYYGSSVAPTLFGAGNKLIHNAVGGIGVLEGNGGTLRAGLPWQSVHDGTALRHEPLRLTVMIHAPRQAISDRLDQHDDVRALFNNRWLHLIVLDDDGTPARRYKGWGEWTAECDTITERPDNGTATTECTS